VGRDRMPGLFTCGRGVLVFSKQTEDLLAGISGCPTGLGVLPQTLLWDRRAGLHGHGGRPTGAFGGFCGQLKTGGGFVSGPIRRPRARSSAFRAMPRRPSNLAAGSLASLISRTSWTRGVKVNARFHKTLRERAADRLRWNAR
jgi:hypothetical protein